MSCRMDSIKKGNKVKFDLQVTGKGLQVGFKTEEIDRATYGTNRVTIDSVDRHALSSANDKMASVNSRKARWESCSRVYQLFSSIYCRKGCSCTGRKRFHLYSVIWIPSKENEKQKELILTRVKHAGLLGYFVTYLTEVANFGETGTDSITKGINNVCLNELHLPSGIYKKKVVSATSDLASVNTGIEVLS